MAELEFISEGAISSFATSAVNTTQMVVTFLFVFLLFALLGFWIITQMKYKHKVTVRSLINGRVIIKEYKAKDFVDSKGVNWWKLKGVRQIEKQLMDVPDSKCIDITSKGNKWVEVYETPTGEYIPIYDKANVGIIPEDIMTIATKDQIAKYKAICSEYEEGLERDQKIDSWKKHVIKDWIRANDYAQAFRPFTTQDRQAVVNNMVDAQERRNKSLLKDLPQMIAVGSLAMIIVIMIIFAPDWFEGKQQVAEQNAMVGQLMQENLLILRDIKLGIQTIQKDQTTLENKVQNLEKK